MLWPAFPEGLGMMLLALQYEFERSERWPAERIAVEQFRQLALLLEHAARASKFHRMRLRAAGWRPHQPLDAATWSRLPLLSRRDLQLHGASLRTKPPAEHGAVTLTKSSGSSGMPVEVPTTALASMLGEAAAVRDHLWHRRDFASRVAVIRRPRPGETSGARAAVWTRGVGAAFVTGESVLLDSLTPVADQLAWLMREDPAYVVTYPSNLRALLQESERAGRRPPHVKAVLTQGESVPPDLAALLRGVWGAALQDTYSASETGILALQCPESGLYHVQSELALVEILGPGREPCAPGETGRVVVTPLHNFAAPLLRYDIGDFAEVGGPCACGRTLPTLARIAGRVTGMLRLPSGGLVRPYFHAVIAAAALPIRQFQVIQRAHAALEVRLVVERPLRAAEEEELRARFCAAAGGAFAIAFTYHGEIARGPGGKFEDFVCALSTDA